jgi:hypothetical protein
LVAARLDSTDEAPRAVQIEHEFWDESNHVRIVHPCEAALSRINHCPSTRVATTALRQEVLQDNDLHIVMG